MKRLDSFSSLLEMSVTSFNRLGFDVGIKNWGRVCAALPTGLRILHNIMGIYNCVEEPYIYGEADNKGNNLQVFNRFQKLQSLTLFHDGPITHVDGPYWCFEGDIQLPCLKALSITKMRYSHYHETFAPHFTFKEIPQTCSIDCDIEYPAQEASKRFRHFSSIYH